MQPCMHTYVHIYTNDIISKSHKNVGALDFEALALLVTPHAVLVNL